jgi:hypothetical protein
MSAVTHDEAKDYVRFFFEIGRDIHPHDQFELRSSGKRKSLDELQAGRSRPQGHEVWILLHVNGNLLNFYRTQIPKKLKLPVLFSPYITMLTTDELDVPETDLPDLARQDTDAVYRLEATIDGKGLTPVRIADSVDDIKIKEDNVFDLGRKDKEKVYFDGYFVKLKPLSAGDHLVESKGYSPHFENDVRYSVYTRNDIL